MPKGKLIVVTAPSGAGKTTLVNELVAHDEKLLVSISHTTRPGRPSEENGVNYHFISGQEFMPMLQDGDFLESAEVYGYHYGTSQHWVSSKLNEGLDVILEIDWQGAAQIRNLLPDSCFIFILPPSLEALSQRLTERAQDDEDTIDKRMQQARSVIEHVAAADFIVVNDDFETALDDLRAIIRSNRLTVRVQGEILANLLSSLTRN
ncbi:MAG: guanylate kinase [Gammaproteobacteria bacterium]|jgi:guanylate kinase|nr:guanylate kinase [Gammaproteobacteria bacterium]MDP6535914.1 guanylate kinase [Gammaproteobacteria bacterium]MDP6733440.1 guanylate kinase [Gammaproteobacteria bacterium]HAJ77363.1 guanylate kinase [Gammaproteobacteria bacterium]|tara:strand:+ start:5005 stop:5622 length:618 start_codon:yes stop_codon:yes gene_type:complete